MLRIKVIRKVSLLFLMFLWQQTYAQERTVQVFDLQSHTVDSLKNFPFDSTKLNDRTAYNRGITDTLTEMLNQSPPEYNLYTGSLFTRKKQASLDYDISKYPLRTSVKISYQQNDTLVSDCSGSMVSRKHVLTAAHCVSGINSNTMLFDSLFVCPVFDNGHPNAGFPSSYVRKVFLFKNWNLLTGDFAILELEQTIGDMTGWISIGFDDSDTSLLEGIYYKFSWPARTIPALDSAEYNGDTMYYNYGKIDITNDYQIGIRHTNAISGESGSSLIKVENNLNYTSYGVLTFSNDLVHSRIDNWKYYIFESIIHDDLIFNISETKPGDAVTLFPNPATEKIWVKNSSGHEITGMSVLDVFGKLRITITPPYSSINLSSLQPGVYVVRISFGITHEVKKVILQ